MPKQLLGKRNFTQATDSKAPAAAAASKDVRPDVDAQCQGNVA